MSDDREYQRWLKVFYDGSFLVPGWKSRKREVLSYVTENKAETEKLLDELGNIIGREWAKDNRVRKISTDDIVRWGEAMKRSNGSGDENVTAAILDIKREALRKLGG